MSFLMLELGPFPDHATPLREASKMDPLLGIALTFFVVLVLLTVMNMLIGILCHVVSAIHKVQVETTEVQRLKNGLHKLFVTTWPDDYELISKAAFIEFMEMEEVWEILQVAGVDVAALMDLTDFIFPGEGDMLGLDRFLEVVANLRGTNKATVKDLADLRVHLTDLVCDQLDGLAKRSVS